MIEPLDKRILVQVNPEQKDYADFGGKKLFLANDYNTNYRERNPVVAFVLNGYNEIKTGCFVVVHHNYFSDPSPFEIGGGIYSIPYHFNILAIVDKEGNPQPVCENIIAERIQENELIGISNHKRIHFHDRVTVAANGFGFEKGQQIFTLPFSDYEIVYNFEGVERRVIRVYKENIVAILKK